MMTMSTINAKLAPRWKDAANGVLGLWLAASPWMLSYASEAVPAWNAHVVGVTIAIAAIAALIAFQRDSANWCCPNLDRGRTRRIV